ncbi:hypothetical protein DBT_0686 [Dissulfuribacter thermophilus]|uniref:PilZ domain-containing protein n=1 Tax=Dissulfuribacter thermophilus TaxID=1156395 RepID=A0A1B9F7M1_9BACT|nr:PilZ domain-containing protein [Dissulfuribacter thermophilus]OCC15761.1 hypothetical protein DBT_0686 [Dissulfuribacter thermophilus]
MDCPFFADDICLIPDSGMYIPLTIHKDFYCLGRYSECVRYKQYENSGREKEDDRRKYNRIRKIIPCATQTAPDQPNSFTIDMSLGGMRIMLAEPLKQGECYDFWLYGENRRPLMDITACVRWTKPSFLDGWYEAGLAFTPSVHEEYRERLVQILSS